MNLRIYTMIKQAEELASAVNNAAQEDPAAAAPTADAVQADQAAAEGAPADNGLGELSPTEQKMIQYKRKIQGMAQNAGQQLQTAGNKIGDWMKQYPGGMVLGGPNTKGQPQGVWDERGMYPGSLKDMFFPKSPQQTGNI